MSIDCSPDERTLTLSFKFSEYLIQLEHKHIKDIGTFAVFCLRAFRDSYSINQISQITNINSDIIEKQLKFLVEKSYIDDSYNLDTNGKDILHIYDFIEKNNTEKNLIYFEHYIKNPKNKKINMDFSITDGGDKNTVISNEATGIQLPALINQFKMKSIFDEIVETEKDKLLSYLSSIFHEDYDLIQKNMEEFIFKLIPTNKEIFYNKTINIGKIKNLLSNSDGTIFFSIPVKEYKSSILSVDGLNEYEKNWFRDNQKDLNFSISLFDGSKVNTDVMFESKEYLKPCSLPKLFDDSNYLAKNIIMPLSFFYNISVNKSCKVSYFLQKITEEDFNKLLEE
jgi:hypothetical protein